MAAGDVDCSLTQTRAFKAAVFDGVNDYIDLGSGNLINEYCTISFRYRTNKAGTAYLYSCKDSNPFCLLMLQTAGGVAVQIADGAGQSMTYSFTYADGQWHHFTVIRNGTEKNNIVLYFDGVLKTGVASGNAGRLTTNNIGGTAAAWFQGSLCKFRIWNRCLTPAECALNVAGYKITDGLTHEYLFADDYNDNVGTANATNHGTYLNITEDQVSTAIKTLRTASTNSFLPLCKGMDGQILSTRIKQA